MNSIDPRVKTVTSYHLDYADFEAIVNETWPWLLKEDHWGYKEGYRFVLDIEGHNDSSYSYSVEPIDVEQGDEYARNKWKGFMSGKSSAYMAQTILDQLCYLEIIPAGKYIIDVCW